ncbi:TIGR03749 family integrating conjugative element protein [Alcaligenaceae bacterium CGII-47]|nr:TIGR03749 family integrating conjugative element protein [Alcaligenaceae bacterium CGII-47]
MKSFYCIKALWAGIAMLCCVPAVHAVEILHWNRLPLAVPLVVGQERVVFIDRNVRVGVPARVQDTLRVQSAGGAIYLKASEAIAPSRLQLQDVETGSLILLDIAAEAAEAAEADAPPLEPVRIVDASQAAAAGPAAVAPAPPRPRHTPVAVVLTRHAAQSLYAPLRTVDAIPGLMPMTLPRKLPLKTLLPNLPLAYQALGAWRLDGTWVTAVRLRNTGKDRLMLDARDLQGDFVAASFQHATLGPTGLATDTTTLYLVTRGPLSRFLSPAVSRFDARTARPAAVQPVVAPAFTPAITFEVNHEK